MAGKVIWHGDAVRKAIQAEMVKRLSAVGVLGANYAKELISVPGDARQRDEKGRILKGQKKLPKRRSRPGDPPYKQTGHLRRSVAWEVNASDRLVRIGTNLKYGLYLELGTRKMAARPWLRRMLIEKRAYFKRLLTAPMKLRGQ